MLHAVVHEADVCGQCGCVSKGQHAHNDTNTRILILICLRWLLGARRKPEWCDVNSDSGTVLLVWAPHGAVGGNGHARPQTASSNKITNKTVSDAQVHQPNAKHVATLRRAMS